MVMDNYSLTRTNIAENDTVRILWLGQTNPNIFFRFATPNDVNLVYEWANDPLVRINSFNSEPIEFNVFVQQQNAAVNLIAHCEPSDKKNIKEIVALDDVNLLIGPEGDFSSSEIATAISNNYTPIQLGPTRLRTETAGIFALSVLKIF
jgi:hypothetical protein